MVFEEGFCRHSLEAGGADKNPYSGVLSHDPETIKKYFGELFYPHVLVSLLACGIGQRNVFDAFFNRDVSHIADLLKTNTGKGFGEIERPFAENGFRKVTLGKDFGELNQPYDDNFRDAMDILMVLSRSFEGSLGRGLKETMQKLLELVKK